jgi:hypothetical protein
MNGRMVLEYGSERRFDQNIQVQLGTPAAEGPDQGEGKDGIAERSKPNEQQAICTRQHPPQRPGGLVRNVVAHSPSIFASSISMMGMSSRIG